MTATLAGHGRRADRSGTVDRRRVWGCRLAVAAAAVGLGGAADECGDDADAVMLSTDDVEVLGIVSRGAKIVAILYRMARGIPQFR